MPAKIVWLFALVFASNYLTFVFALGSSCRSSLSGGTAARNAPYWLQEIKHQGIAAYNNASDYQVFRNVKDYGAVGDGVTDDTAAINAAIADGNRCGNGCPSSTVSPALIFFPQGTYYVTAPVVALYYSALIGDARKPPTIVASANFSGYAIIDADPYTATGEYYGTTVSFYRSIRNINVDMRSLPANTTTYGLHWRVSQGTSLMNMVFDMSTEPSTTQTGLYMEDGSGGFFGDLIFNGGQYGLWVGNQQFTVRNVTVNNAQTALYMNWNWGWTFQGFNINNCQVGIDINAGVEGMVIVDAIVHNTPIFVRSATVSTSLTDSIVINNARLYNVPTAVGVVGGITVLPGSHSYMLIDSWGQGNVYYDSQPNGTFVQTYIPAPYKPASLLDSAGNIFGRMHPQYEDYSVDQFVSVRSLGAKGDGIADDTDALQAAFDQNAGCKIVFVDAGTYKITKTLTIPAGSRVVGEAWSNIAASGSAFANVNKPIPAVQVGEPGSVGVMEISDIMFTTIGPTPGAILVEWNVAQPQGQTGATGMWDSHVRIGGAVGTEMEIAQCPSGSQNTETCRGPFMGIHLTKGSTAYIEGTWTWTADHDIDGDGASQLTIFAGRGFLSESEGPVWLIGTATEHWTLYNYHLNGASNHYIGFLQTETPYYQPIPQAPAPWSLDSAYNDPTDYPGGSAWAFYIENSLDIMIFGAGDYSFFQNYSTACEANNACQPQIVDVRSSEGIKFYSLSTVSSTYQISMNEKGIVNEALNANGFASTLTFWESNLL